jgi:predicted nucleotidyltransferase
MDPVIKMPRRKIAFFCRKHHIKKMSIFGSVLRDDFGKSSDIDFLVEFEKGYTPSFFLLFDMEEELTEILGGRKADIRTKEDLSRYFREDIEKNSVVQYVS